MTNKKTNNIKIIAILALIAVIAICNLFAFSAIGGEVKAAGNTNVSYFSGPDPDLYKQWALKEGTGIDVERAWTMTTGSNNVRVGVMDTGIDDHPDFYNINGQLQNIVGSYFCDVGVDPMEILDCDGHGTQVAGIIGAVGDNGIGVSGINKKVSMVSLTVINNNNDIGFLARVIEALRFAKNTYNSQYPISILNLSTEGYLCTENVYSIHDSAWGAGGVYVMDEVSSYPGLLVWAAGNDGYRLSYDIYNEDYYPENRENLISVGAIDRNGNLSVWGNGSASNYGEAVDIYAPGGCGSDGNDYYNRVWTTQVCDGYRAFGGTSSATPHVTGVAALMLSVNPTLSASEIKTLILNNADEIEILTPDSYVPETVKKLNAYKSVAAALLDIDDYGYITGFKPGAGGPNTAFTGVLDIPSVLDGKTVVGIADYAFYECPNITSVILPETVTSIGEGAFCGCTSLSSINIPYGVTTIGEGAFFFDFSLTSITIPSTVTSIGDYAFAGTTGLTSITNESVTPQNIGSMTFAYINKANVDLYIPSSTRLAYINAGWGGFNIIEPWETVYNGIGLTISGINYVSGGDIVIPSEINGVPVTAIGDYAFQYQSSLTSVTVPSSVTTIGDYAFCHCFALTDVNLSSGLTTIGVCAFAFCSSMTVIDLPSSVESIGICAFYGCSDLETIIIRNDVSVITCEGWLALVYSDNLSIYVPYNLYDEYQIATYWCEYTDNFVFYAPVGSFMTCESFSLDAPNGNYYYGWSNGDEDLNIRREYYSTGFIDHMAHLFVDYSADIGIPYWAMNATLHIEVGSEYDGNAVLFGFVDYYEVIDGCIDIDISGRILSCVRDLYILPADGNTDLTFTDQDITILFTNF